jgi:hypothetical protein
MVKKQTALTAEQMSKQAVRAKLEKQVNAAFEALTIGAPLTVARDYAGINRPDLASDGYAICGGRNDVGVTDLTAEQMIKQVQAGEVV